uniref:C-type lectin domain-containing protein n=1 Tax=Panagrolaimus sp. ES5 TaxID=591445 RepID=A0AC34FVQ9_9BILA
MLKLLVVISLFVVIYGRVEKLVPINYRPREKPVKPVEPEAVEDDEYDQEEQTEPVKSVTTAPPAVSNRTVEKCPSGWTTFAEQKKCLMASNETLEWHKAQEYCKTHGAHLLTVHGKGDLEAGSAVVSKLLTSVFWIGLYKDTIDGTWKFTNNEVVGELPGLVGGAAYCSVAAAALINQNWPCSNKFFGICQIYIK